MALGAVLLVDSPVPEMRIRWGVAVAVSLGFTVITIFLLSLIIRAHRSKVQTGVETMPGRRALAVQDLAPGGRIFLDGDYWNAISSAPVAKGESVRVKHLSGLTVYVEPETESSPFPPQP